MLRGPMLRQLTEGHGLRAAFYRAQLLLAGDDGQQHRLFHIHNPYGADVVG